MSDLQHLLDLLAGAGDVGIYLVAFILWKFDRRLVKIEAIVMTLQREVNDQHKTAREARSS